MLLLQPLDAREGVGKIVNWRVAFFVTLALALTAIGFLTYLLLDQSVSYGYLSVEHEDTVKDLESLAAAFPHDRYNRKDVLAVLRRNNPKAFIVETPCAVQMNGLLFEFDKQGGLVRIATRTQHSPGHRCGR